MKVKNIIIISDAAFVNGGAVKVAIQSAIGLSELGYHVEYFCAVDPVCKELKNSSVKVTCLNQRDILSEKNRLKAFIQGIWNCKAYNKLNNILSHYNENDTIIHSHVLIKALSPSVWAVLSKYNFKVFVTLHDYFLFCPNGGMYNYRCQVICSKKASGLSCYLANCDSRSYAHKIWRDIRQVVQNATFRKIKNLNLISISNLNKKVAYPYLNRYVRKWYELHNPVENVKVNPVAIADNDYYLFIGRLSPEKGIDLFCEAITRLTLKAIVLGDGDLRKNYQSKYPNITFTGWVTGQVKEDYIKRAKALVFSSKWYEGAPLTILEMKAYGIPCIVPDRCAASEEIQDGKTGFVFKTGDLESLVNCISKYEKSNILALQKNLVEHFSPSEYSLDNHCRRLIEIYNQ